MDPGRIHAYLQAACAGLGFDIGEVWFSSNDSGTSTVAQIESQRHSNDIKFLQLYTSRSYKNRRNDLLRPETEDASKKSDNQSNGGEITKHVLSPKLVNAIANTAQVVWANCQETEGLLGRSDMRLQTAVGMPVAMDSDGNMCVVVMFSPNNVQSNKDAVEYLKSLSQGATSTSIPCLLPVMDSNTKKLEYNPKRFSDWEEHDAEKKKSDTNKNDATNSFHVDDLSNDFFGIPVLPPFAELDLQTNRRSRSSSTSTGSDDCAAANAFDQASYGLWSTIMENPEITTVIENIPNETTSAAAAIVISTQQTPLLHPERQARLEEFSSAFLAMSVFEIADFWIPSSSNGSATYLHHVFSLSSNEDNPSLNYFKSSSTKQVVNGWSGAVGRAYCSGIAVWSTNMETVVDTGRTEAFAIANIKTALAVPIFSSGSVTPSCVLSFYSLVRSDCVPFVLKFVEQALRSLWLGLECLQPHESIGEDLWKDVAPADLGEMAADLEMQKAFYQKKRPYDAISSKQDNNRNMGAEVGTPSIHNVDGALSLQLQALPSPSGETSTFSSQGNPASRRNMNASERPVEVTSLAPRQIQSHLNEAIKSVSDAQPISTYERHSAKRANLAISPPRPASLFVPPATNQTQQQYLGNFARNRVPVQSYTHCVQNQVTQNNIPVSAPSQYIFNASQNQAPNGQAQHSSINQIQPLPCQTQPQPLPQPVLSQNTASSNLPSNVPAGIHLAPQNPNGLAPPSLLFCADITKPIAINESSSGPKAKNERPICRIQGCETTSAPRRPYCTKHSGNRICEHPSCTKCAQGATRFCIGHGGGRRCTYPGCDKGARDKFFCAAHGGGKRCKAVGCKKSAVGGSNLCTSHGGGRRCAIEGCEKSAQSSTKFCVKHGGGKKCSHPNCEKVARGKTQYCAGHGGGVRCKLEGCSRIAIGKMQLCRAHGGGSTVVK